jgi:alpha-L-arabinofuranosidase
MGASLLSAYAARAGVLSSSDGDGGTHSSVEVLLDELNGTISPDLYGYLLENLGTVIYDGIWVGEGSKIPNIRGIRKSVIDRLREIKASVIRWPGGDFADYYDWEDGIGPRSRRPRRTNKWSDLMPTDAPSGPQRYDPNWFGTPEFMQLCKLCGGRPFLSVNARGLTPQSFYRWVDYCNSPEGSTTLADARKRDGSSAPYRVRYWEIGNEVSVAGGGMSVEEYATVFKKFTTTVPHYDTDIKLIASGAPPGKDVAWVRDFLRICRRTLLHTPIDAISLHYYAAVFLNDATASRPFQDLDEDAFENALLDATKFGPNEWYKALESCSDIERTIDRYWNAIGEFDEHRRIKISVDEWGAMYRDSAQRNPLNITGRGVTLRDGVTAALTLDTFNKQCSRLCLANFTGLINQEGGLLQAEGDRFCVTPAYHVFSMYRDHQGGNLVRTEFNVPMLRKGQDSSSESEVLKALSGSASVKAGKLTLTVVNPHISEPHESTIRVRGNEIDSASATVLTNVDVHAQNTFADPEQVLPKKVDFTYGKSSFRFTFPAASVTVFTMALKGA